MDEIHSSRLRLLHYLFDFMVFHMSSGWVPQKYPSVLACCEVGVEGGQRFCLLIVYIAPDGKGQVSGEERTLLAVFCAVSSGARQQSLPH